MRAERKLSELSTWRKVRAANFPRATKFLRGEFSTLQNFHAAKFPQGKISCCEITSGETTGSEISRGEITGHALTYIVVSIRKYSWYHRYI